MWNDQAYTFDEYQTDSAKTAVYPDRGGTGGLCYLGLGLCGEAGEVAEKIKKIIRDYDGVVDDERKSSIAKEIGDVSWYLSEICTHFGISLADVARGNVAKLQDRQRRGVLGGSGDNR